MWRSLDQGKHFLGLNARFGSLEEVNEDVSRSYDNIGNL